jgi:glutamine cyclotransferase
VHRILSSLIVLLAGTAAATAAPTVAWQTVAIRPHDAGAFTEGLVAHSGVLLESTGLEGASSVRRVRATTGAVLRRSANPADVFGEGLTVLRGTLWQLTWREHRIYGYDPRTLTRRFNRPYPYEGWGLTTDGRSLIASDGTPTLRWMSPRTLRVSRTISVTDGGQPVANLNELEMIDGAIWANVWLSDRIAIIDPSDGHVRAWLDLASLDPASASPDAVLNGIAVDPVTRLPLVTGKLWPRMYVIRPEGPIPA